MSYLLDTNICIYIIKRRPLEVLERFQALGGDEIALSMITVAELMYGAEKSQSKSRNRDAVHAFALNFECLPFDFDDAAQFGIIRAALAAAGRVIGPYDMMIAAQALQRDLTLVTNNVREFERVERLRVENWVA